MKKTINKKSIKLLFIVLIIFAMTIAFTGCGFVPPDTQAHDDGRTRDEGGAAGTNKLCTVYDDDVTGMDTNGFVTDKPGFALLKANAGDKYGTKVNASTGFTIVRDVAIMMYNSAFAGTYPGDNFSGDYNFGSLTLEPGAILTEAVSMLENGSGALDSVMGALSGLAFAILLAVWSMGFISQIVNEKFTMETLLKTFMQLFCGVALIIFADSVVNAFAKAGLGVFGLIGNGQPPNFSKFSTLVFDIMNNGIISYSIGFSVIKLFQFGIGTIWVDIGCIFAIVLLALPIGAQIKCAYQIISSILIKMIELEARIAFSPIPIAFSAQNGFSQEAIRYFRGVMACAMQPALMMAGVACFGTVADAVTSVIGDSGIAGMISMTVSYMVLSAYFGETKHLANEIIAK